MINTAMQNTRFLELRTQWFKLKAKEFIKRYAAGLLLIAILLPAVAVGDNLKVFLLALTQPFLIVSSPTGSFLPKLVWSITLYLTFLVWVTAQKKAIDGGEFAHYLRSLPISFGTQIRTNVLMILLANHFLWIFMLFGLYHLVFTEAAYTVHIIRYALLIVLLISAQYVVVFSQLNNPFKKQGFLYFLMLLLIVPLSTNPEWIRVVILFLISVYVCIVMINNSDSRKSNKKYALKIPVKQNLYLQMLFKSSLPSTCFRTLWMISIIIGFTLIADHFKSINNGQLEPYFFVLTALLAFFISGFYLLFRDQRLVIKNLLLTLPVPHFFWVKRDLMAVILISIFLHTPLYFWQLNQFNHLTIIKAWVFHLFLLLVSYPIRIHAKEPTFSTFITLLIISIIYIYNFT